EKNIRGIIVTHGHMDHIGAFPHVLGPLGNPIIYTAPLTAGMIKKRMEEHRQAPKPNIVIVKRDTEKFKLGKSFAFQPFHINHNISDAFGAAIDTPYGKVLVTGDFKFDYSPVNEEPADLQRIAMFGAEKPLLLCSDSTDSESPGYQISEKIVGEELDRAIASSKDRIIVGTFSSLLTRVQQLLWAAEKNDRKVMILGRSMKNAIDLAHELGYLKYKKGIFVTSDREFKTLPDNKVMIICTGAQGEKNAALMRIATGEHRQVSLKKKDTIIFSSSVIPGNERTVQSLKDTLVRKGAHIIHYKMMDIHAGGHAKQEDLKLMLRLTQPKFFMPIHGNRYMLHAHTDLAVEMNVPRENTMIADNGQIIECDEKGCRLTDHKVETEYVMVDGLGVGDVSNVILRERQALADDGMFVVICTVRKKTGQLVGNPDLISRGFVYMKESKDLIEKTRAKVKAVVQNSDPKSPAFEDYLKRKIRDEVGQFLYAKTHRRPMVLPVLIEV
ncbi:MAG: ribonuclease J, partial [Parcubacteria group bacterium]|nr:ribonuclease J [Parcubacteria group bacterium]